MIIAAGAGGIGGLVGMSTTPYLHTPIAPPAMMSCPGYLGAPCDLVMVRLQNDMKLPPADRRNYKHVFDGLYRIARFEGTYSLLMAM